MSRKQGGFLLLSAGNILSFKYQQHSVGGWGTFSSPSCTDSDFVYWKTNEQEVGRDFRVMHWEFLSTAGLWNLWPPPQSLVRRRLGGWLTTLSCNKPSHGLPRLSFTISLSIEDGAFLCTGGWFCEVWGIWQPQPPPTV